MSGLPWNEYAIRCELKLVLENEPAYLAGNLIGWTRLGQELRKKYGVSQEKYDAAWLSVGAALHPDIPKFRGIKAHNDSCIPSEHEYNAKQLRSNAEQAHRDVDSLISRSPFDITAVHDSVFADMRTRIYGPTTGRVSAANPTPQQLPKEPNIMSDKPIEITTRTYVNGADISALSDAAVYELIAKEEAKIEDLGKIKAKPKKLEAEIVKRQEGIAALVAHLDSKVAA